MYYLHQKKKKKKKLEPALSGSSTEDLISLWKPLGSLFARLLDLNRTASVCVYFWPEGLSSHPNHEKHGDQQTACKSLCLLFIVSSGIVAHFYLFIFFHEKKKNIAKYIFSKIYFQQNIEAVLTRNFQFFESKPCQQCCEELPGWVFAIWEHQGRSPVEYAAHMG